MKKEDCRVEDAYPFVLLMGRKSRILLWIDGHESSDYFLTDENRVLVSFSSLRILRSVIDSLVKLHVHYEESVEFDINAFWKKLGSVRAGRGSSVDTCNVLINGWNHLDDLVRSARRIGVQYPRKRKIVERVYKKLIFGCQLPSLTPPGKKYIPVWTENEATELRQYLRKMWEGILKNEPTLFGR